MEAFGTDAWASRIVDSYSPMLLRLAATRLDVPSDAQDVVQDVFLRLLSARPRFRDVEHEKAWLIRATLNRACDLRRAAERRNVPLDEAGEAAAPIPPPEDGGGEAILSAVRALPAKYSAVIHLYYYEGFSIREIAQTLRLPASTVGSRLARGRDRLRKMLKEEFYGSGAIPESL